MSLQELEVRAKAGAADGLQLAALARRQLEQQAWSEASHTLQGLLKRSDAPHPWTELQLARCYVGAGSVDAAYSLLQDAVQRWPENPEVHLARADFFAAYDDTEAELATLRQLVELAPGELEYHRRLARAAFERESREEAEKAYGVIAARRPNDAEAQRRLGYLKYRRGAIGEAVAHARRAVALDSQDARHFLLLGVTSGAVTGPDRAQFDMNAEAALRRAAELDPNLPGAQTQLGLRALAAREPDAAFHRLKRAVELNPYQERALLGLVTALEQLGERQEAEQYRARYERLQAARTELYRVIEAHRKQPDDLSLERKLGYTYLELGQWRNARRHLAHYLRAKPDPEVRRAVEQCTAQVGKADP